MTFSESLDHFANTYKALFPSNCERSNTKLFAYCLCKLAYSLVEINEELYAEEIDEEHRNYIKNNFKIRIGPRGIVKYVLHNFEAINKIFTLTDAETLKKQLAKIVNAEIRKKYSNHWVKQQEEEDTKLLNDYGETTAENLENFAKFNRIHYCPDSNNLEAVEYLRQIFIMRAQTLYKSIASKNRFIVSILRIANVIYAINCDKINSRNALRSFSAMIVAINEDREKFISALYQLLFLNNNFSFYFSDENDPTALQNDINRKIQYKKPQFPANANANAKATRNDGDDGDDGDDDYSDCNGKYVCTNDVKMFAKYTTPTGIYLISLNKTCCITYKNANGEIINNLINTCTSIVTQTQTLPALQPLYGTDKLENHYTEAVNDYYGRTKPSKQLAITKIPVLRNEEIYQCIVNGAITDTPRIVLPDTTATTETTAFMPTATTETTAFMPTATTSFDDFDDDFDNYQDEVTEDF